MWSFLAWKKGQYVDIIKLTFSFSWFFDSISAMISSGKWTRLKKSRLLSSSTSMIKFSRVLCSGLSSMSRKKEEDIIKKWWWTINNRSIEKSQIFTNKNWLFKILLYPALVIFYSNTSCKQTNKFLLQRLYLLSFSRAAQTVPVLHHRQISIPQYLQHRIVLSKHPQKQLELKRY